MSKKNGDKGEEYVMSIFTSHGYTCNKNKDKKTYIEYDLECEKGKNKFRCEVKFDLKVFTTNNLAIETWNSKTNKPSGLSATTADYWVVVLLLEDGLSAYITTVKKLKEFVDNNKPDKLVSFGGDKNATLKIYSKDKILAIFNELSNKKTKEVDKLVNEHNSV